MQEIRKDIEGYDGRYKVSDLGRVKSFFGYNIIDGKIRKLRKKDGYLNVGLTKNGKAKKYRVHRLVYLTFNNMSLKFLGAESKTLVLHKDDNKENNKLDNLFLGTQQDNVNDMMKKGRYKKEKFIKYNKMIEDYKETKNISKSSKKFGVGYQTARKIIKNHKNL